MGIPLVFHHCVPAEAWRSSGAEVALRCQAFDGVPIEATVYLDAVQGDPRIIKAELPKDVTVLPDSTTERHCNQYDYALEGTKAQCREWGERKPNRAMRFADGEMVRFIRSQSRDAQTLDGMLRRVVAAPHRYSVSVEVSEWHARQSFEIYSRNVRNSKPVLSISSGTGEWKGVLGEYHYVLGCSVSPIDKVKRMLYGPVKCGYFWRATKSVELIAAAVFPLHATMQELRNVIASGKLVPRVVP